MLDTQSVLQILALIGSGIAAAKYVDSRIEKFETRINKDLDEWKMDTTQRFVKQEADFVRFQEHCYHLIGDLSQKAQILVAREELRK